MGTSSFRNRADAGQHLAKKLAAYAERSDVLVLALPRGGVPVAFEVAKALQVSLDTFLVRKLGVPGQEELAMGAIAGYPSGGTVLRMLNKQVAGALQIPEEVINKTAAEAEEELARRETLYRGDRPAPDVQGRTVILIDDGLATGSTMRCAAAALRQQQPTRIVVAVPVGAPETCESFRAEVDEVVCVMTPTPFYAVGLWYEDFAQTTDEEVHDLLQRAAQELPVYPVRSE